MFMSKYKNLIPLESNPDPVLSIIYILWCLVLPWSIAARQIGPSLGKFGNYYQAVGGYGAILSYAGNQLMIWGIWFYHACPNSGRT